MSEQKKNQTQTRKKRKAPVLTIGLFAAAIALLATSGVGVARAAAARQSELKTAELELQEVGVNLNENGTTVAKSGGEAGALLTGLLDEGEELQLNTAYDEVLNVTNTGTIDEYVRVVLDLYWVTEDATDGDQVKETSLTPDLIKLNLTNSDSWIVDPDSSYLDGSGEQLILYYAPALAPGADSVALSDTLTIDGSIASSVSQEREGNIITTVYKYDGVAFGMRAEVDAIQTHNAKDAALSSWGVTVGEGDLSALAW